MSELSSALFFHNKLTGVAAVSGAAVASVHIFPHMA
jgi:hypothetical protein